MVNLHLNSFVCVLSYCLVILCPNGHHTLDETLRAFQSALYFTMGTDQGVSFSVHWNVLSLK